MSALLFRRYVWLLDKISEASRSGGITFDEISRAWEFDSLNDRPGEPLAKRTFNNHIQAISEAFGIDIVCRRQGGYNYVIESEDNSKAGKMKDMLLNYLLASNIQLNQIDSPYMILPKINIRSNISSINPIFRAMTNQHKIKILWGWKDKGECCEDRWITLEPYYVKGYSGYLSDGGVQWYVFGRGEIMKALQAYDLDNIKEVIELNETFSRPTDTFDDIEYKTFHQPNSQMEDDDSLGVCIQCGKESQIDDNCADD